MIFDILKKIDLSKINIFGIRKNNFKQYDLNAILNEGVIRQEPIDLAELLGIKQEDLEDLVEFAENLFDGGFAGMGALDEEYKAPDNNYHSEIVLRLESEPFLRFYQAFPELRKREKRIIEYKNGRQIINSLVEAYNGSIDRLERIESMVRDIPKEDREIIESAIGYIKIENYFQNNKLNEENLKGG